MDAATLWRTRVTWALLGAGVTLAITSLREREDGAAVPGTVASASAGQASGAVPTSASDGPSVATPTVEPTPAEPTPVVAAAVEPLPATFDPPLVASAPLVEPAPVATPPVTAFEIPLPLMPGARVMKRGQRPDEELGGTIYTLTLSVPAPGMQVESFYRRALADEKLSVAGGSTTPSSIGSGLRTSLRGRGRDASVHVNLQQRAGKLRTTVRIIWRSLP